LIIGQLQGWPFVILSANQSNVVSRSFGDDQMLNNGRIPLWMIATVAGTGVLLVVGLFFYGAYAGIGSSM
jgi:photosystem II PsbJ protein